MKNTLYETPIAELLDAKKSIPEAVQFLVRNRDLVLSDQDKQLLLNSVNVESNTFLNNLYRSIVSRGKISDMCFTFFREPEFVPSLLLSEVFVIDLFQIPEVNKNIALDELKNKAIVNITRCLKKSQQLQVNDSSLFTKKVLLSYLIMKDGDKDYVMSPVYQRFLIKSYSMIVSAKLARTFNLDDGDKTIIKVLVSFYYAKLFHKSLDGIPPIMATLGNYLPSFKNCETILDDERISDLTSKGTLSLYELCNCITKMCSTRLKGFSEGIYRKLNGNLGGDANTSFIIHDYPMYWLYAIIVGMSEKSAISFYFRQTFKIDKEAGEMLLSYSSSREFLNDVRR